MSTFPNSDYDFPHPGDCIEITYSVLGYEEAGETTFDMDVNEKDKRWLSGAEDDGEYLDSDYISENRVGLHKRILRAIRKDMEERSLDADDGMVAKRYASLVKEYHQEASHQDMSNFAEDEDIEYTLTL